LRRPDALPALDATLDPGKAGQTPNARCAMSIPDCNCCIELRLDAAVRALEGADFPPRRPEDVPERDIRVRQCSAQAD
jgi:hypothetical protein